eukprot:8618515-Pyramimonas_sp.AAC.1
MVRSSCSRKVRSAVGAPSHSRVAMPGFGFIILQRDMSCCRLVRRHLSFNVRSTLLSLFFSSGVEAARIAIRNSR